MLKELYIKQQSHLDNTQNEIQKNCNHVIRTIKSIFTYNINGYYCTKCGLHEDINGNKIKDIEVIND